MLAAPIGLLANTAVDRQIEETAESSFNYRVALEDHVKVRVSDGVVKLIGKVCSEEQSRLAVDTVADIPGVVRVDNQVKIKGERGPDSMTALKVRSRLLVKGNVSLKDTRVDVKDGVVFLSGRADDQAQKELTEEYTKDVDGVRAVRNDIVVSDEKDRELRRIAHETHATFCETLDDPSITAQLKYELYSHKGTSGLKTKVSTNNGHVVIFGEAPSESEKELVTKLAKTVRGVESVDNNMTVRRSSLSSIK